LMELNRADDLAKNRDELLSELKEQKQIIEKTVTKYDDAIAANFRLADRVGALVGDWQLEFYSRLTGHSFALSWEELRFGVTDALRDRLNAATGARDRFTKVIEATEHDLADFHEAVFFAKDIWRNAVNGSIPNNGSESESEMRFRLVEQKVKDNTATTIGLANQLQAEAAEASRQAVAEFTEALRLDPKNATAYSNRAYVYSGKGDTDRAIADLTEAIRLDPKFVKAYSNRGVAYSGKGDTDRAIADYNEAIRLDPKNAHAYVDRGLAYEKLADFARARG
jgi:tetratricopeptide (TPR) repeat protein